MNNDERIKNFETNSEQSYKIYFKTTSTKGDQMYTSF